jgi:hypothetical protein
MEGACLLVFETSCRIYKRISMETMGEHLNLSKEVSHTPTPSLHSPFPLNFLFAVCFVILLPLCNPSNPF